MTGYMNSIPMQLDAAHKISSSGLGLFVARWNPELSVEWTLQSEGNLPVALFSIAAYGHKIAISGTTVYSSTYGTSASAVFGGHTITQRSTTNEGFIIAIEQ